MEGGPWLNEASQWEHELEGYLLPGHFLFPFSTHHKVNSILLYLPYHQDGAKEPWTKLSEIMN